MEQVLDRIHKQHKEELFYKRNHLSNRKRKSAQLANPKPETRRISQSIQIQKTKQITESENQNYFFDLRAITKEDHEIIRKYLKNNHDIEIKFPKINNSQNITLSSNSTSKYTSQGTMNSGFFPRIMNRKMQKRKQLRQKFKRCINVVRFIIRLKKKVKQNMKNLKKLENYVKNLHTMMDKMINKYYSQVLKEPLSKLGNIIQESIKDEGYEVDSLRVVMNILSFSEKLKQTSIRKDIVEMLAMITKSHAFVPLNYFSQFQLLRQDFHHNTQQIGRVNKKQLKMIVTVFLGIKLLSNYMFLEPEKVNVLNLPQGQNEKRIDKVVQKYREFFYWFTIQQFQNLPTKPHHYLEKMIKWGWQPQPIYQQDNNFYNSTKHSYKKKFLYIRQNLIQWINRITAAIQSYQQEQKN